jgi:hypothetical protein
MKVRVGRRLALVSGGWLDLGDGFDFCERDPDLGTAHGFDDEHRCSPRYRRVVPGWIGVAGRTISRSSTSSTVKSVLRGDDTDGFVEMGGQVSLARAFVVTDAGRYADAGTTQHKSERADRQL